jgi:hypothetical protein
MKQDIGVGILKILFCILDEWFLCENVVKTIWNHFFFGEMAKKSDSLCGIG